MCQWLLILFHYFLQFSVRPIKKHKNVIEQIISQFGNAENNFFILDFGCGEGIFSGLFKDNMKIKYIGIDRNFNYINFANKIYKLSTFVAGDENLCFKNRSFDFIILSNTLHHMKNNEISKLLLEIKRVLNEKGFLIILELVSRHLQKGFFFKFITFLEEKFKNINYCDQLLSSKLFHTSFKKIFSITISSNFKIYVFSI